MDRKRGPDSACVEDSDDEDSEPSDEYAEEEEVEEEDEEEEEEEEDEEDNRQLWRDMHGEEDTEFEPLHNLVEELADDEIEFSADDDIDRINSMMRSHMSLGVEGGTLEEERDEPEEEEGENPVVNANLWAWKTATAFHGQSLKVLPHTPGMRQPTIMRPIDCFYSMLSKPFWEEVATRSHA